MTRVDSSVDTCGHLSLALGQQPDAELVQGEHVLPGVLVAPHQDSAVHLHISSL